MRSRRRRTNNKNKIVRGAGEEEEYQRRYQRISEDVKIVRKKIRAGIFMQEF